MKKTNFYLFIFFFVFVLIFQGFSQNLEKLELLLDSEIESLTNKIEKTADIEEKKALLHKLAKYQELSNMFPEAEKTYCNLASICSGDEKIAFVLAATESSLSYGNEKRADELLASIAEKARNGKFAPQLKLYAVWSWLSKCSVYDDTYEPVAVLKSYLDLPAMQNLKPQILFTLFYITGQLKYAKELKDFFPHSMEYGIVCRKIELSPSPFWFFSCRKIADEKELAKLLGEQDSQLNFATNTESEQLVFPQKTEGDVSVQKTEQKKQENTETSSVQIIYYQLGFFSSKENALDLVKRAKKKNIDAEIQQIKRPSGNTYFAVIVKTDDMETGMFIRNSGFECYPIFAE
ncbi:MAG: SPOR domain-containing protein [Treponemataceae bacterium]